MQDPSLVKKLQIYFGLAPGDGRLPAPSGAPPSRRRIVTGAILCVALSTAFAVFVLGRTYWVGVVWGLAIVGLNRYYAAKR